MSLKALTLTLAAVACASPFQPLIKGTSDDPCEPCQPQGATGTNPPAVGSDLSSLYIDVLESVRGITFQERRSIVPRAEGFCCRQSLDCVNVQNLNIAMCYDKFTTNFAFADGSYGSLTTGNYSASGGATANLFTGEYTSGGSSGNIYASDAEAKPNTATLAIPPQWTGTGVGGPIPASELGSVVVYTTTIPGTTITAPTTLAESVMVATVDGKTVSTTVPAITISQATTIAPKTNIISQTAAASSSSTGAAVAVSVDSTSSFGISVLSALMYALYGL